MATSLVKVIAGIPPGSSTNLGDGGPATSAYLNSPGGLWLSTSGFLLVADLSNSRIRRINLSSGIITTFAGTTIGFSGDGGPATSAQLHNPYDVWGDSVGNVFIADTTNNRVRVVNPSGIIRTFAGTGPSSYSGDGGPATSAALYSPISLAGDTLGNLYFADSYNCAIRYITKTTGIITTFVGQGPTNCGYTQTPVARTSATIGVALGIFLDTANALFFCERGSGLINMGNVRRVSS
jgi:sugar lactone lactonase YvrE